MRFRLDQRFGAPPAVVEAAFVDPEFLERLAELPKLGRPEVLEQREEGDLVHQRVRYRFAGQLSSAVTRVVDPARLTWVEESTLDRRTHRTDFVIVPDHYPGRLRCGGRVELAPLDDASASRRVVEGEVVVMFPLVGRLVERAIVSGLAESAGLQSEVMGRWLAERAS